jgi:hypothetical protein
MKDVLKHNDRESFTFESHHYDPKLLCVEIWQMRRNMTANTGSIARVVAPDNLQHKYKMNKKLTEDPLISSFVTLPSGRVKWTHDSRALLSSFEQGSVYFGTIYYGERTLTFLGEFHFRPS